MKSFDFPCRDPQNIILHGPATHENHVWASALSQHYKTNNSQRSGQLVFLEDAESLESIDGLIYLTSTHNHSRANQEAVQQIENLLHKRKLDLDHLPAAILLLENPPSSNKSPASLASDLGSLAHLPIFRSKEDLGWQIGASKLIITDPDSFQKSTNSWIGAAFSFLLDETENSVFPRIDSQAHIPGGHVAPLQFPDLQLTSLTSDKAVYQEGRDVVHLLVIDPLNRGRARELIIEHNGQSFQSLALDLDPRGLAAVSLRDLPGGSFALSVTGFSGPKLEILVAEYSLAALSAQLLDQSLDNDELTFEIALDTYGVAINTAVLVDLRENEQVLSSITLEPRAGRIRGKLPISGQEALDLMISLVKDPSKTAVIPLRGSRQSERTPTLVGNLGGELEASLLPSQGSSKARGLHLRQGEQRKQAIRLSSFLSKTAKLTINEEGIQEAVVLMWDLAKQEHRVERFSSLAVGTVLEITTPSPMGLLLIGCIANNEPWEAWTTVIAPEELTLEVTVPEQAIPGTRIPLEVTTASPESPATVYVLVKDDRLASESRPEDRLAASLKETLAQAKQAWQQESPRNTTEAHFVDPKSTLPPILSHVSNWISEARTGSTTWKASRGQRRSTVTRSSFNAPVLTLPEETSTQQASRPAPRPRPISPGLRDRPPTIEVKGVKAVEQGWFGRVSDKLRRFFGH